MINAGSHFVRENAGFRAIPNAQNFTFTQHLTQHRTTVPVRSAITALQITIQLRRPRRQSTTWMPSTTVRSAPPYIQLYNGGRI